MCWVFVFGVLLIIIQNSVFALVEDIPNVHRRYEYLYSFKGPLLIQKDGLVPFWEHGGHAIPSEDKVRLAPSMRNKRGYLWSKKRADFSGFEMDMSFRVTGSGKVGADGLALWFVEEKTKAGPVYGLGDKWKGLAVFFDTYDNDGQLNNPIITAMVNDGTKVYDHDVDGEGQYLSNCIRDFRNRPFPILVRVRYFENTLTVFINNGNTDKKVDMQRCFTVKNVKLPAQGYYGISAATGQLADDHDVMSFEVHSLTSKKTDKSRFTEEDRKRYEKEFKDHMEKMKKAQEEYEKAHKGDKKKPRYKSEGDEAEEVRRFRQIWLEQSAIHLKVDKMNEQIEEILGLLKQSSGGATRTDGNSAMPQDFVRKTDLLAARDHMSSAITDVKYLVEKIQPGKGADTGSSAFYELRQMSNEIREGMDSMRESIRQLDMKMQPGGQRSNDPSCPTCLTTTVFITFTICNALIIVGAVYYKLNQEASAKKFY